MKNKRGDLAVTLLVFLVVMLCAVSLYAFASTNSVSEKKIASVVFSEGAYLEADYYEFGMSSVVEEIYLETYMTFLESETNYINCDSKYDDVCYFDSLKSNLDSIFRDLFLEKFSGKHDGVVNANLNADLFSVVFSDMEFTSNVSGYFVNYSSDISYEFNFVDQGLIGFRRLDEVRVMCGFFPEVAEVKNCFNEEFKNFDVSVSEVDKYFNVVLRKDEIEFNFLIG